MERRSIRSYLPYPDRYDFSQFMQARISRDLKRRVLEIAKRNCWTPSEVIRAGLRKFVDDESQPGEPLVDQAFRFRQMELIPREETEPFKTASDGK